MGLAVGRVRRWADTEGGGGLDTTAFGSRLPLRLCEFVNCGGKCWVWGSSWVIYLGDILE